MEKHQSQDYLTYKEVMADIISPISGRNLDDETRVRLTHSKLVYLENLRIKCFREINGMRPTEFTTLDYELILNAIHVSRLHMREAVLLAIGSNLSRRKAS